MLDTNMVSDIVRHPQGAVAHRIAGVGETSVCTSIIVASELRFGAAKRQSQRLTRQVALVLDAIEVLPFDAPADLAYGDLRAKLEAAGTPIGANDMLIAAHSLSLSYMLITDNEREFTRVEGLSLENWLRAR